MVNILPDDGHLVILNSATRQWKIVDHIPDNNRHLESGYFQPVGTNSIKLRKTITVFLTNKCNLRCGYCRFQAMTHTGTEIANEDVDSIVSAIQKESSDSEKIGIYFQGGEPLLRPHLIDKICSQIKALDSFNKDFKFYVQTNGTVLNQKILDVLIKHNISIGISIDGLKKQHDANRPYPSGHGSYDDVLKAFSLLKKKGIDFGIFCVIENPNDMESIWSEFIVEHQLKEFLFSPLEISGEESQEELEKYLHQFIDAQIEILMKNIQLYLSHNIKIKESLTHSYLQRKIFPEVPPHSCSSTPFSQCGEQMISLERNGTKAECQNLREKQHLSVEARQKMMRRYDICNDCEIRGHCSTPVCFSRMSESFNQMFAEGDCKSRSFIEMICRTNKYREKRLFRLMKYHKNDVLKYFFAV